MDTQKKKVGEVAGCLIEQERTFMLDYSTTTYTGEGEIVDLGCFLGSSTYPLAAGLQNNANVTNKEQRIFAYDRFEWNEWMNRPASRYELGKSYSENECFVDEFKRQMGDLVSSIIVVKGDLTKLKWQSDSPIEYCFVDAMKNWELCNSIIQGFFPAMKPGLSFLHHQDYVFFQTYWIHLTMYRMRDHFEPVDHKYLGPSRIFKYTSQMPAEMMSKTYRLEDFSTEEIHAAFDHAMVVTHEAGHANIAGCRVWALLDKGCHEEASAAYEAGKQNYPGVFESPAFGLLENKFDSVMVAG